MNYTIRYFSGSLNKKPHESALLQFLNASMDFLLFFILTGLMLAIAKRFYSRITGLKKITKHTSADRLALTLLCLFSLCVCWLRAQLLLFQETGVF